MLIKEFWEELKKLSNNYDLMIDFDTSRDTSVFYKNKRVLIIKESQFNLYRVISHDEFERLPFSHKLWMLASELSMTPYIKRLEQKYNVIIGEDETFSPYMAWIFSQEGDYLINFAKSKVLQKDDDFQFTDSEFKDLISYIKTLPDGEFQAKVAEHGKRLVEETEK